MLSSIFIAIIIYCIISYLLNIYLFRCAFCVGKNDLSNLQEWSTLELLVVVLMLLTSPISVFVTFFMIRDCCDDETTELIFSPVRLILLRVISCLVVKPRIVVTSGYFNPLHYGHISLLREAKKLGDKLIVIVNSDEQVKIKGSQPFLNETERAFIVSSIRDVDTVVIARDKDGEISDTLKELAKTTKISIFAKGGDRKDAKAMPEKELATCSELGIEIVYGVGGFEKQNSSSEILAKMSKK